MEIPKGFKEPKIEEDNWKLGAVGDYPVKIYQPNGDWSPYLPPKERQRKRFETYNCTAFATLNVVETLLNRIKGETDNLSDRYLGLLAGTDYTGNSPHKVAETLRNQRVCKEKTMPFGGKNINEYYSFKGVDENKSELEAREFPYEVKHRWLWTKDISEENRKSIIREALKRSPICASVYAWEEEDGVYVNNGRKNSHWTMIYGETENGWLCFDSYSPFYKVISFDHSMRYAKEYALVKKTYKVSLMEMLLDLYKKVAYLLSKKKIMTKQQKLLELSNSKIGTDFTPDWAVSDEVSCAYAVTTLLQEIDPEIPIMTWTPAFDRYMENSDKFERIPEPVGQIPAGSIVISPTNSGNGLIRGHTGIYMDNYWIASNNSYTGLWEKGYNRDTWRKRYYYKGGMPIRIYKLL